MLYDIIIPKHYKDAVAPVIAGKQLIGLSATSCVSVLNAIADFVKGSAELYGLLASLNMQYICQNANLKQFVYINSFNEHDGYNKGEFKSAKIFQETDIAVGNVYLIHNRLVLIRATDNNRFLGVLVTSNIDIIVECKRAMLIGSFKKTLSIPTFEVEITDCYILYTPALGVFWGFNCDDYGKILNVEPVKYERTLTEGVMHFVNRVEHNFNLFITTNPNEKDQLIEKIKDVIDRVGGEISAKWFHFDEMELFHIPFSRIVKQT